MMAIAVLSTIAGFAAIVFAFVALFLDRTIRKNIEQTAQTINSAAVSSAQQTQAPGQPANQGLAANVQAHAAVLSGASEYVKALAELAGNLSKVSQAVAALLVATIFFLIAASLVAIDHVA